MSETTERPQTAPAAQLPSPSNYRKLAECKTLGEAFETQELRARIEGALPKHLHPDTMLHAFVNAVGRQPLLKQCDMRQVLGALMSLTHLGLVPGTVEQEAHLIPFKYTQRWNPKTRKKEDGYDLQVIVGYPGYIKLAYQSGFIRDLQTGIYLPGDDWREVNGTQKELYHSRNLDIDQSEATPKAAYAVVHTVTEGVIYEVMTWHEILAIRNRSSAYRRALRALDEAKAKGWRPPPTYTDAPWVRDERQMARKTTVRRISHVIPKSPDLRAGVALEEQQEAGRKLDFGPIIDGTYTPYDGVPEVADEEDEAGTAGSTFTDRRVSPPANDGNAGTTRRPATTRRTSPPPAEPPPSTFEAALIDQHGEIVGTFDATTPGQGTPEVKFAAALHRLWLDQGRDGAIIENNGDAIDQARGDADAAVILARLDEEPPPAGSEEPPPNDDVTGTGEEAGEQMDAPMVYAPVLPPMDRGRPQWTAWLGLLRDDLATIDPQYLDSWTEAQRSPLTASAMAQRALAVKAIVSAYASRDLPAPPWLNQILLAPKPAPADTAPKPTQHEKDKRWVEDRIADLNAMANDAAGRQHFDTLVLSTNTRTVMARLRRDDPDLFKVAENAFNTKNDKLPKPRPGSAP